MTEHNSAVKKRTAVDQLSFDGRTAKRVGWEAFEFTIVGPHQVEVTNASYGCEKGDHTYTVGVEKRGGIPAPAECECPADLHRESDCKHKVALATIGGPVVLNAAVDYEDTGELSVRDENVPTVADKLQTDGGTANDGEASQYAYHTEPAKVGGSRFVRCNDCGAESVPANPDRLSHFAGCSEGQR